MIQDIRGVATALAITAAGLGGCEKHDSANSSDPQEANASAPVVEPALPAVAIPKKPDGLIDQTRIKPINVSDRTHFLACVTTCDALTKLMSDSPDAKTTGRIMLTIAQQEFSQLSHIPEHKEHADAIAYIRTNEHEALEPKSGKAKTLKNDLERTIAAISAISDK